MTKIEAIIEKVAKLRALAAKAGTRAEAEAAAARAEALIAEYQLDEAQLEDRSEQEEEIDEAEALYTWEGANCEKWRVVLACGLAKIHGCYSFHGTKYESGKGNVAVQRIAGRRSDIIIVRYLFAWLTYEIDRLAQSERGKSARHAFRVGAVNGFLSAMRAAQKTVDDARAQESRSVAIVLSDRAEMSKTFFESGGMKFRKSTTRVTHGDAYGRGQEAGRNLSPRSGLGGGSPLPMLR